MVTTEESNLCRHSEALAEESKIDCHSELTEKLCQQIFRHSELVSESHEMLNVVISRQNTQSLLQHDSLSEITTSPTGSTGWEKVKSALPIPHDKFVLLKKKVAFTLAEVLITLSILGVVAAITVPSLVHKIQDRTQITAFKKAYSILDNALNLMMVFERVDSLSALNWPSTGRMNYDNGLFFGEKLSAYLPVKQECGRDDRCFTSSGTPYYADITGSRNTGTYGKIEALDGYGSPKKFILKDGSYMSIPLHCIGENPYNKSSFIARVRVDTNGIKGPNRYGYDVFDIWLNHKGIYWTGKRYILKKDSDKNLSDDAFSPYGHWVIKYNNMDYKYRDVSAEW